jgi:hypothetical protein
VSSHTVFAHHPLRAAISKAEITTIIFFVAHRPRPPQMCDIKGGGRE